MRWAESLLECAAMSAAMKKLALVLLIALLPVQALAATVAPLCQQDAAAAPDHGIRGAHLHAHDAPAQDQPLTVGDAGSDHCSAGSVFALPATHLGWAGGPALQRDSFTATHCSGFIPEQPQRPPRV